MDVQQRGTSHDLLYRAPKDLALAKVELVVAYAYSFVAVGGLKEMLSQGDLFPKVKLCLDVKLKKVHPIEPEHM